MAVVAFDTLAFVKRMQAAGMEPRQAEAFAEALGNVVLAQMVTVDHLDLRLKELEQALTLRMGAMAAATITILGALIAFHR